MHRQFFIRSFVCGSFFLGWVLLLCAVPLWAQSIQAVSGKPLGVASIQLPIGQVVENATVRVIVSEAKGRIFFPAVDVISSDPQVAPRIPIPTGDRPRIGALVQRIRNAVDAAREQVNPPEVLRVQFLFTGNEPLAIQLTGDVEQSLEVVPVLDAPKASLDGMLGSWWTGYVAQAKKQVEKSDYPPIIENYLVHMLANRFGFEVPELSKTPDTKKPPTQSDPLPTLSLIAGVESLRADLHKETLRQTQPIPRKMVPVPAPPQWLEIQPPATPDNLPIESIASRVPPECFYIRFGSFSNSLWFQEFGKSRGGDLAQLAILRGINYQANARLERLLSTKSSAVAKMFGDSLVSDMAIIGQDLYLHEGPAMGILFEAKNAALLKTAMMSDRTSVAKQMANIGCKLETIEIAGRKVSYLGTPDQQIRSFLVDRDNYLLVTSSRAIAERFLAVCDGQPSLAQLPAFRFARYTMPVSNDYSVFVYLSSQFFRNLVSPHYQIELRRRLKAIASIEIAEMASLVAESESGLVAMPGNVGVKDHRSIDRLIEGGYLPPPFQDRVDGSQTLRYKNSWHDSLRGARGSFLPIPDVPLTECSPEEAQAYQDQAAFYATQWQQTDPLMVGVRRFQDEKRKEVENLVVEAYIAPLGREKYGWISTFLGQPVQTEIELPRDDIMNLQVHMSGEGLAMRSAPDHVLFAGIKDMVPPLPGETIGLLATLRVLKSIPGYVGTWPSPGYLDRLPFGLGGGRPDVYGFSRTLFGLWRWQANGFSVISFDRGILDQCIAIVKPRPSQDYAQGRIFLGDVKNSQVASFFNVLTFRRAAQTSRGNLMLLDSIQQQLHVEPAKALQAAETLIDAKLQCTLEGEYKFTPGANGESGVWYTTAWDRSVEKNPKQQLGFNAEESLPTANYQAPWLGWFRGAQLHLTQLPERLVLVGTVAMERLPVVVKQENGAATSEALPDVLPSVNLDIFNLPFQFFQGDKPKGASDKNGKGSAKERKGADAAPAPSNKRDF